MIEGFGNQMTKKQGGSGWVLGIFILLGLSALGYLLGQAAIQVKEYERTVTAKGLSEREYPADVVIWPVLFRYSAKLTRYQRQRSSG